MPFFLYKKVRLGAEWEYLDPVQIKLAGGGLIQKSCKEFLGTEDVGWALSTSDLIKNLEKNPLDYALVVDTSPGRDTVNLFKINMIAGYSYNSWTPLLIVFEQLFGDAEDVLVSDDGAKISLSDFKKRFRVGNYERDRVRSFLYVKGGYEKGDWNWGGNSRTTAALLWDPAWNYLNSVSP